MPAAIVQRQPEPLRDAPGVAWFATAAGRAVLDSEDDVVRQAANERPGQPWLCLSVGAPAIAEVQGCLGLQVRGHCFEGPFRCGLPLPIANESLGTVLIQHVGDIVADPLDLFRECQRVLVPGGRLWLFALNPLAPYRWRWQRAGPVAREPVTWRRRLRNAGLQPEAVSHGLGPRWRIEAAPDQQHGAGLRAAFLLRAEKRLAPLTPMRARPALRLPRGVPAASAVRGGSAARST